MIKGHDESNLLPDMSSVVAIVLGGGRGERLYPLTAYRAKPAVPLLGRYRLVDIPISNCIHSGVNRAFVLTQFNSASLNRHINNSYKFDGFSNGFVEVLAAEQTAESGEWYQGTADAVRKQLRQLRNIAAKDFLILSGDQLYRMDYRELLKAHLQNHADITVSALPVSANSAKQFGILKTKLGGEIVHFVEKPETEEALAPFSMSSQICDSLGLNSSDLPYLASMGVYVFRKKVLLDLLDDENSGTDFGKHLIPNSLRNKRVFSHVFGGFWKDVGTIRSYYDVSMQLVALRTPFRLNDPKYPIFSPARNLPSARIQNALLQHSIVCDGARLKNSEIYKSVIGVRTAIGAKTSIQQTILMGADYFVKAGLEVQQVAV